MGTDDPAPVDVSVVIPVYEDPEGIARTLAAVTDQTAPASDYEVVVVDNGSSDGTREVIRPYCTDYPDLVTMVVEETPGAYAARNAGIDRASGDILAFVDADMTVERSWLDAVRETMATGHDYVGFRVGIVARDSDSLLAAYNRQTEFPVDEYLAAENFAPTCCLAVSRDVLDTVGRFDERMCSSGDAEFGKRVAAAGFEQHYEPGVTMYHPARSTRELLSKYFRIGRGFCQRQHYHPDLFSHRSLLHPGTVLPTLSPSQLHESAQQVTAESDVTLGLGGLIAFYALDHLTRLATAAGRAYERLSMLGRRQEKPE